RERDDLHEVPLPQLACNRAEDAGASRIVGVVDQHSGILVERNVGAILAPQLLAGADDHCLDHLAFLDGALRCRALDGADDDVADTGIASLGAPPHPDAKEFTRAGVVGHSEACLGLDHLGTTISLFRLPLAAASSWYARRAVTRSPRRGLL